MNSRFLCFNIIFKLHFYDTSALFFIQGYHQNYILNNYILIDMSYIIHYFPQFNT